MDCLYFLKLLNIFLEKYYNKKIYYEKKSFNIWYNRSRWIISCRVFVEKKVYCSWGKRRSSSINTGRIDHIYQDPYAKNRTFILHYGDITDSYQLLDLLNKLNQMKYTI